MFLKIIVKIYGYLVEVNACVFLDCIYHCHSCEWLSKVLNEMAVENQVVIDKLTQEIYEMAGEEFNINSPKQLGVILFEKMGLPLEYTKKTKTGYSTAVDVLERLAPIAPIVAKILDHRGGCRFSAGRRSA